MHKSLLFHLLLAVFSPASSSPVPPNVGTALGETIVKRDNPILATNCGGYNYEPADLRDAYNAMVNYRQTAPNGPGIGSSHGNFYPHVFNNHEDIPTLQYCQDGSGTFWSWPLLQNGLVFGPGDNEGPDRVVLVETTGGIRAYCGAMTHTGAPTHNGFVRCT